MFDTLSNIGECRRYYRAGSRTKLHAPQLVIFFSPRTTEPHQGAIVCRGARNDAHRCEMMKIIIFEPL